MHICGRTSTSRPRLSSSVQQLEALAQAGSMSLDALRKLRAQSVEP